VEDPNLVLVGPCRVDPVGWAPTPVYDTGNKAIMAGVLTEGIDCTKTIDIASIYVTKEATTFGDMADSFISAVYRMGKEYRRIDAVFHRYIEYSIKAGTRQRQTKTTKNLEDQSSQMRICAFNPICRLAVFS
jgi:hypothetical protein